MFNLYMVYYFKSSLLKCLNLLIKSICFNLLLFHVIQLKLLIMPMYLHQLIIYFKIIIILINQQIIYLYKVYYHIL